MIEMAYSTDGEFFSEDFWAVFYAALDDVDEDATCVTLHVGEIERPAAADYVPSAADIIDIMAEQVYDDVGEAAEDWPDRVGEDAHDELNHFLWEWAHKHCPVNFYRIRNRSVRSVRYDKETGEQI